MSSDFGGFTLPYCAFVTEESEAPRVGVGVGTSVLDLTTAASTLIPAHAALFDAGNLDLFMAA